MTKQRVDEKLVALGLAESIDVARALVMAGKVMMAEEKVNKPSEIAKEGKPLRIKDKQREFVSRGGQKLKKAIECFDIDLKDRICMDVGASTGGFTDVMLRSGAQKVYAIDVGYNQLDFTLRRDERVSVMERTNARFLTSELFDPMPSFGATDVSFISLRAVLPASLHVLSGENRRFVALIKPQFEATAELVGEKGVVRDPEVHIDVISGICEFVEGLNWRAAQLSYSPITGPEGNIEFLLDLWPMQIAPTHVNSSQIRAICYQASNNFMKS